VRETYKYFSGISPSGSIPSIGGTLCQSIFVKVPNRFIDYRLLKPSDIDLSFIQIKNQDKMLDAKVKYNPERQLTR
jgi:hypothetical protein